jgi:hypothetical protein
MNTTSVQMGRIDYLGDGRFRLVKARLTNGGIKWIAVHIAIPLV